MIIYHTTSVHILSLLTFKANFLWLHNDYKHANVYSIVRVSELQTIIIHRLIDWFENFLIVFLSFFILKIQLFGQPASSERWLTSIFAWKEIFKTGINPCMSMDKFSVLSHLAHWRLLVKNGDIRERSNIKRRD